MTSLSEKPYPTGFNRERRDSSQIEFDSSVMNLFDASMVYTAAWRVGDFAETVQKAGYRGLEWHPIRASLAGLQFHAGLISLASKEAIRSLHQSWRSEQSWKEAVEHPTNPKLAKVSYILFPERVASLKTLERLQRVVGRELPVVLYPEKPGEERGTERPFAEKLFQPTPGVMRQWGVRTPRELIDEARRRRYTGFAVDLFHMRARDSDGTSFERWQETLPELLSFTAEIHVAAGRVDIAQSHIDTQQELRDLLTGSDTTDILPMLRTIQKSNWHGRVVTEIPAAALHELRKDRQVSVSIKDVVEDHRRIVDTVQTILLK